MNFIEVLTFLFASLATLVLFVWLGLQIKPKPFPHYPILNHDQEWIDLPEGLPAPVEKYYRQIYGEQLPLIRSAVLSGRARLRFMGITFPSRFRFVHKAGFDYRHYIESCCWGKPVLKVNEHYMDCKARLQLPFGVVENEPKVDQAANLGLWAESFWFPAVFITDPRPRWESIDEHSAWLYVPFKDSEQQLTVHFDPKTGLLQGMRAMRWKQASDSEKTGWNMQALEWHLLEDWLSQALSSVTWEDEGSPWAFFELEEVILNEDVEGYLQGSGI